MIESEGREIFWCRQEYEVTLFRYIIIMTITAMSMMMMTSDSMTTSSSKKYIPSFGCDCCFCWLSFRRQRLKHFSVACPARWHLPDSSGYNACLIEVSGSPIHPQEHTPGLLSWRFSSFQLSFHETALAPFLWWCDYNVKVTCDDSTRTGCSCTTRKRFLCCRRCCCRPLWFSVSRSSATGNLG
jgi:hypothetical protein